MKLIIGLGNPGKEYHHTRHNVGFLILDALQQEWGFSPYELKHKFQSAISTGLIKGEKALLIKPQTFMNLSGEAIHTILDYYKLSKDDIVVIHDDMDIALGKFKVATDSTSAGHNGVQNIIDHLGTKAFKRLRIGIGQAPDATAARPEAKGFVLDRISKEEEQIIDNLKDVILDKLQALL